MDHVNSQLLLNEVTYNSDPLTVSFQLLGMISAMTMYSLPAVRICCRKVRIYVWRHNFIFLWLIKQLIKHYAENSRVKVMKKTTGTLVHNHGIEFRVFFSVQTRAHGHMWIYAGILLPLFVLYYDCHLFCFVDAFKTFSLGLKCS